jgi:hypothetical protein
MCDWASADVRQDHVVVFELVSFVKVLAAYNVPPKFQAHFQELQQAVLSRMNYSQRKLSNLEFLEIFAAPFSEYIPSGWAEIAVVVDAIRSSRTGHVSDVSIEEISRGIFLTVAELDRLLCVRLCLRNRHLPNAHATYNTTPHRNICNVFWFSFCNHIQQMVQRGPCGLGIGMSAVHTHALSVRSAML